MLRSTCRPLQRKLGSSVMVPPFSPSLEVEGGSEEATEAARAQGWGRRWRRFRRAKGNADGAELVLQPAVAAGLLLLLRAAATPPRIGTIALIRRDRGESLFFLSLGPILFRFSIQDQRKKKMKVRSRSLSSLVVFIFCFCFLGERKNTPLMQLPPALAARLDAREAARREAAACMRQQR